MKTTEFTKFIESSDDLDLKAGYEYAERSLHLGAELKRIREFRKLTQSELQEKTGIHQTDISRIEAGNWSRGPTLDTWVRLTTALGVIITVPDLKVIVADEFGVAQHADIQSRAA